MDNRGACAEREPDRREARRRRPSEAPSPVGSSDGKAYAHDLGI
jgi:hypothetical protein